MAQDTDQHAQATAAADLAPLRERIDALDRRLVELLSERAGVVQEVGRIKHRTGTGFYAPEREAAVFDKLRRLNPGPLPDKTLFAMWRELMSGSLELEKPLRIGYVGPPGGFAHHAAVSKFGRSVSYAPLADVAGVVGEVVRGHCDYGMVPAEHGSSILGGGELADTLDALHQHRGDRLAICAEVPVAVRFDLLGNQPWPEVHTVAAKPEVLAACRAWLSGAAGDRQARPVPSVADAARLAAETPGVAALGPRVAGELHGLEVLFEHVGDDADRSSRYFVLAPEPAKRGRDDKTGVLFTTPDRPGSLATVLDTFRRAGVNLSDIEKRPTGTRRREYVFFIELDGHRDDPALQAAADEAREHCHELLIVGSYPRASQVA